MRVYKREKAREREERMRELREIFSTVIAHCNCRQVKRSPSPRVKAKKSNDEKINLLAERNGTGKGGKVESTCDKSLRKKEKRKAMHFETIQTHAVDDQPQQAIEFGFAGMIFLFSRGIHSERNFPYETTQSLFFFFFTTSKNTIEGEIADETNGKHCTIYLYIKIYIYVCMYARIRTSGANTRTRTRCASSFVTMPPDSISSADEVLPLIVTSRPRFSFQPSPPCHRRTKLKIRNQERAHCRVPGRTEEERRQRQKSKKKIAQAERHRM